MLTEMLKERNLPPLKSREEMLETMLREVYGYLPPKPEHLVFENQGKIFPSCCAGNARCDKIIAHCVVNGKPYSFPFYATVPNDGKKHPFFVHINFRPEIFDRYMPTEELIDNGFAVLSFCHNDVVQDAKGFNTGLARVLYEDGKRGPTDPGKIAMWAWASQRVLDYAETIPEELDLNCAIVCGHSRLGKTALLAAATDERFAFACSNNSGCTGAAVSRGKEGERVEKISTVFPYWFCENYQKYGGKESEMPFDQHYLVASIAPRKVLVASATLDAWADPISEQLCCVAAAERFPGGFVCDHPAEPDEKFLEGGIGYHLRTGTHYFSRQDWLRLIEFVNKHYAAK